MKKKKNNRISNSSGDIRGRPKADDVHSSLQCLHFHFSVPLLNNLVHCLLPDRGLDPSVSHIQDRRRDFVICEILPDPPADFRVSADC